MKPLIFSVFILCLIGCDNNHNQQDRLDEIVQLKAQILTLKQQVDKARLSDFLPTLFLTAETKYQEGDLYEVRNYYKKSISAYQEALYTYQQLLNQKDDCILLSQLRIEIFSLESTAETKYKKEELTAIKSMVQEAETAIKQENLALAIKNFTDAKEAYTTWNARAAATVEVTPFSETPTTTNPETNTTSLFKQIQFKQIQEAITKQDKWTAETLLEQAESTNPNDYRLPSLHRKINALPGPPKRLSIDLGNGVTMDLVLIPAGSFTMGSNDPHSAHAPNTPAHKVTVSKPFYIGKYEVTQEQWKAVMGSNPSKEVGDKKPVNNVTWNDCQTFTRKLSDKVPDHNNFYLPTEAQWEYSCRSGQAGLKYCFGDSVEELSDYASWYGVSNGTQPISDVGMKKPNAWGLYDMHGNVWEWTSDWMGSYSGTEQTDPVGPKTGICKIARGGSAYTRDARRLACDSRNGDMTPDKRDTYFGLRVVTQP